jgi:hypothetical protein
MARSETLKERTYYLPTYLVDDKPPDATGECSLFVRTFRLVKTPKGNLRVKVEQDVWSFEDDDAMVERIQADGLTELPAEAESDRLYLPDEFVIEGAKAELSYGPGGRAGQPRSRGDRQRGVSASYDHEEFLRRQRERRKVTA